MEKLFFISFCLLSAAFADPIGNDDVKKSFDITTYPSQVKEVSKRYFEQDKTEQRVNTNNYFVNVTDDLTFWNVKQIAGSSYLGEMNKNMACAKVHFFNYQQLFTTSMEVGIFCLFFN